MKSLQVKPGKQEKVFKDKFLYLSLNSYINCSVNLKLTIQKTRASTNKIKLERYKKDRERAFQEADEYFGPDEEYYRLMRRIERERIQEQKEFQQQIKELGNDFYFPNHKLKKLKQRVRHERFKNCQERRDEIEVMEHKRKVFLSIKKAVM
jgi:hypothetical protein